MQRWAKIMLDAIIGDIIGSVYEWHIIKTKDFAKLVVSPIAILIGTPSRPRFIVSTLVVNDGRYLNPPVQYLPSSYVKPQILCRFFKPPIFHCSVLL